MSGRKRVAVFALVIAFLIYAMGAFFFWTLNPGDWSMWFRAVAGGSWLFIILITTAISLLDAKDW